MHYWRTWYKDGTWDCLRTEKPITAKDVCDTCICVEKKSFLWFLCETAKRMTIR